MATPREVEGTTVFIPGLLSIEFRNENNVSVYDVDLERVRDKKTLGRYLAHHIGKNYHEAFLRELEKACRKVFGFGRVECFADSGNVLDWAKGSVDWEKF